MNNFLERVKENILTDDAVLREAWLAQIMDYPFVPAEFTNKLVALAGDHEDFRKKLFMYGEDFEKNADTIQLLSQWMDEFPVEKHHLIVGFLKNTPTHILLQHEAELTAYMPTGYFDVLKNYYSFEADDVDDYEPLWEIFGELLANLDVNFDLSVFFTAKLVQDLLIRLGEYDETEIKYILRDEIGEDYVSVNGILAVRAVGVLQLHKHVSKLVPLLQRNEEDILLEEACEALIRLQSDEAVKLLEPYIIDPDYSIFTIAVLKQTKTALAEKVLLEAYSKTDDVSIQESIIEALAAHFSEGTFDLIEQFIERGDFSYMIEMDELFYAFYKAMKKEHPLLEQWRADVVERNEQFEQDMQAFDFKAAIREKHGKVGRNDPCVCGSGKKFKKCCGK